MGWTWGGGVGVLLLGMTACGGGMPPVRTGPPVHLPSGPPRSACEQAGWYELVPTRLRASGMESGVFFNTHYSASFDGVGVFRPGEEDVVELDELWTEMREPALHAAHQERIQPVDDASSASLTWALVGLGGMAAGLGTAVATAESSPTVAGVFGVGGLVVGVVGVIGALTAQPSAPEQAEANARRRLFVVGEDDPAAVVRGISRLNDHRRSRCVSGR